MRRCEETVRATERIRDIRLPAPLQYALAGDTSNRENLHSRLLSVHLQLDGRDKHQYNLHHEPKPKNYQHTTNKNHQISRNVCNRAAVE